MLQDAVDDPRVRDPRIGDDGDDLHPAAAGAQQRIDLEDFAQEPRPVRAAPYDERGLFPFVGSSVARGVRAREWGLRRGLQAASLGKRSY